MKVTAKATRSGGWWAVEVPEVPGAFTQTKRLDQVAEAAAAAVADLVDVPVEDVEVHLAPALTTEVLRTIKAAQKAAADAARAQEKASAAQRAAVMRLRKVERLSSRDTGVLLGLSHQRVSQLEGA